MVAPLFSVRHVLVYWLRLVAQQQQKSELPWVWGRHTSFSGLLLTSPKKESSRSTASERRAKARRIAKGLAKRLVEFGRA
mmetsp:Transcript_21726/g.39890  ORF Transcript_21726/g.39890 Transcript_21726/m.39890 type:complete len:80 (-) Transcript_21726:115-354(-)